MSLFVRTYGSDEGIAGEPSDFLSIPQPVGVRDGDLIIVGIALLTNVTVTPPDDTWTQLTHTDKTRSSSLAVFWKIALNEQTRWVFSLSNSIKATGAVVVYGGYDSFNPIEAYTPQLTAGSASHGIGAITASLPNEELLFFCAAGTGGSYSELSGSGFQMLVNRTQSILPTPTTRTAITAQRRLDSSAGTFAGANATFSTSTNAASVIVAIRPAFGTLSVDQIRERFIDAFPDGVDLIYDLTSTGDYYKLFQSIAATMKTYAYDFIDLLKLEVVPYLSRYKLPDWEHVFGLETSRLAKSGTVPQRQAQVLASWRHAAGIGFSLPEIQGVLAPILGYSSAEDVEIVETPRADLTTKHTYSNTVSKSFLASGAGSSSIYVWYDGGLISQGGVIVTVNLTHTDVSQLTFKLTAPDGTSHTWTQKSMYGSSTVTEELRYQPAFVGKGLQGKWTLTVTDFSANAGSFTWSMFAEGMDPPVQRTGAAVFHWGVYADPDHLGENGTAADLPAAHALIQKMSPAHAEGNILYSKTPRPGVASGEFAAIPGRCVPV
jgi:hypothetical protein